MENKQLSLFILLGLIVLLSVNNVVVTNAQCDDAFCDGSSSALPDPGMAAVIQQIQDRNAMIISENMQFAKNKLDSCFVDKTDVVKYLTVLNKFLQLAGRTTSEGSLPGDLRFSTMLRLRHKKTIQDLFNTEASFQLCFRASRDGFNNTAYHVNCDFKSNTWTVLKCKDTILTAFSRAPFDGSVQGYIRQNAGDAWINKLQADNGYLSSVKYINSYNPVNSTFSDPRFGPSFGDGNDLLVDLKNGVVNSKVKAYAIPNNQVLLGGASNCNLNDLEVYTVSGFFG